MFLISTLGLCHGWGVVALVVVWVARQRIATYCPDILPRVLMQYAV